ncbi:S8 family serine peptidase [Hyphomonadaceae bacterium ML37]|nr:S8 family serine peptidase [Hyphomonadaceae bacterium ML37]
MTSSRGFVRAAILALIASVLSIGSALAAPIELSEQTESRLERGERIHVIVMFDFSMPPMIDGNLARYEDEIGDLAQFRDEAIRETFGVSASDLAKNADGSDAPRILPGYDGNPGFVMTPGAAMVLNREEIERLAASPRVARIIEDELSDPIMAESLPLTGATVLHNAGTTGTGVGVAILDTGVDHQHPAFADRITGSVCFSVTSAGQNATSFCPNGGPIDTESVDAGDNCENEADAPGEGAAGCFHGTHVAGIASGATFEASNAPGLNLTGMAPDSDIIAVQVFTRFDDADICGSTTPPCTRSFTSSQVSALEWLFSNHVALNLRVINMSLGGGRFYDACPGDSRATVINNLRDAGVATVIASGNDGFSDSIGAPACIPGAIATGSTTKTDSLSSFSNSSPLVALLAPGQSIDAATHSINDSGEARATRASGTSMAAPHAAGAFALLFDAFPSASVGDALAALQATGTPVTNPSNNITQPRIRVDLAAQMLEGGGNAGVMGVTPTDFFVTEGALDEPGSFGTRTYTLRNNGGSTLNWTVSSDAAFLQFTSPAPASASGLDAALTANGSLAPGATTTVQVSVNAAAFGSAGEYFGNINFTTGGGDTTSRAAYVTVTAPPPPPVPNDDFENAFHLSGLMVQTSFSNEGASKEPGEPNHANNAGGASVWWSWRAPADGTIRVDTARDQVADNDFDTTLAVYTGSDVGGLTMVAQNDDCPDAGSGLFSCVQFTAEAGETYAIAVDGYNGDTGNAVLNLLQMSAPANDNIADAVEVVISADDPLGGSSLWTTIGATAESGEPAHAGSAAFASVWFRLNFEINSSAVIDTTGSQIPTRIAVYSGAPGNLTEVVSDASEEDFSATDMSPHPPAVVRFEGQAGQTYFVAFDGAQGMLRANFMLDAVENHRLRAAVLPNARSIRIGDQATAFATIINPASANHAGVDCLIAPPSGFPGLFTYRETNPSTNEPVGPNDPEVPIAPGAARSFVFAFDPGVTFNGEVFAPVFTCANIAPALTVEGVNTMVLTSAADEVPDLISVAATIGSQPGVSVLPAGGATAFAVSAINIGAPSTAVQVSPEATVNGLPVNLSICETNPDTGVCLSPRTASVTAPFDQNAIRTFSIRVEGQGQAIAFAPATNRIEVRFVDTGGSGVLVGGSSVAVRTSE